MSVALFVIELIAVLAVIQSFSFTYTYTFLDLIAYVYLAASMVYFLTHVANFMTQTEFLPHRNF